MRDKATKKAKEDKGDKTVPKPAAKKEALTARVESFGGQRLATEHMDQGASVFDTVS